jgi:hypothetical protein
VIKKEDEKVLKYKSLIKNSGHVEYESKIDTGNYSADLEPFQNHSDSTCKNTRKGEIKELQNTVVLGTAHTHCGKC